MRTGTAARRIGISPHTLRSWERRYKLPTGRSPGGHRDFPITLVTALRDAYEQFPANAETTCHVARARVARGVYEPIDQLAVHERLDRLERKLDELLMLRRGVVQRHATAA